MSGQCKVYGDLTLQYDDLTNDDNLVSFFNDVLARREELDKVWGTLLVGIRQRWSQSCPFWQDKPAQNYLLDWTSYEIYMFDDRGKLVIDGSMGLDKAFDNIKN